jgi:hypothetical protein
MFKHTKSRLYVMATTTCVALMCVLSVSNASAQGSAPSPPPLPTTGPVGPGPTPPASNGATPTEAPVPPDEDEDEDEDEDGDEGGDEGGATSTRPAPLQRTSTPRVPVSPSRVMGPRVRRSGRALYVNVSCGRSGTVTVSRKSRRIGRRTFVCPANRSLVVRVRLTPAAAARLRAGTIVRVTVRAGDQRHTKSMRVRVVRALARSSSSGSCTPWYWASKVGHFWQASSQWAEFYCSGSGQNGGHLMDWWRYYVWNGNTRTWDIYGGWNRYHQDGCSYFWSVAAGGASYGPYGCR